jgi:hypothetical protein
MVTVFFFLDIFSHKQRASFFAVPCLPYQSTDNIMSGRSNSPLKLQVPSSATKQRGISKGSGKVFSFDVKLTGQLNTAIRAGGQVTGLNFGILLSSPDMRVATVGSEGQLVSIVKVGDQLVGINGVPLNKCMKNPGSPEEFMSMMLSADPQSKVTLNFNGFDDKFEEIIKAGVEVTKLHSGCCGGSANRVLYMDNNLQVLMVSKSKGADTQKIFSVHELEDVVKTDTFQFQICAMNGDVVNLKTSSAKSTELLVKRLHRVIFKAHQAHGNEGKMKPYKPQVVDAKQGSARKNPQR